MIEVKNSLFGHNFEILGAAVILAISGVAAPFAVHKSPRPGSSGI
jgi:hypothetical protein